MIHVNRTTLAAGVVLACASAGIVAWAQGGSAVRKAQQAELKIERQQRQAALKAQRQQEAAQRRAAQQQRRAALQQSRQAARARRNSLVRPGGLTPAQALATDHYLVAATGVLKTALVDLENGNHYYNGMRARAYADTAHAVWLLTGDVQYDQAHARARLAATNRAAAAGEARRGKVASSSPPVKQRSPGSAQNPFPAHQANGIPGNSPERDHYMSDALSSLQSARATLLSAPPDARGIRTRAANRVGNAIAAVSEGLAFAQAHPLHRLGR